MCIKVFDTQKQEELYVKDCIVKAYQEGCSYEEMAILYRTNSGARFWWRLLWSIRYLFRCGM